MGMKLGGLEDNELRILALLKNAPWALQDKLREGLQLPRRLLDYALLRRDESGEVAMLPAGERLLFQQRCIGTLRAHALGAGPIDDDAEATAWLISSRFLICKAGASSISARGAEWLEAVDPPASARDRSLDC